MTNDIHDAQALDALFTPRSIAILGASSNPMKIGGVPVALLRRAGFAGEIVPVNPASDRIQGLPAVPTLAALGRPVDMAVVALPARLAEQAVADSLAAGARSIVMFTAGLGETGAEGKAAEARMVAACRAAGARLLGPNTLGVFAPSNGLFATFSASMEATWPAPGGVAIASQSGAVGSYCYAMLHARGIGISRFIATGNEADIDVAECIDWLAGDAETKVIATYLEGAKDGRRLAAALHRARAAGKRVIALKVGRSAAGTEAVSSHTGSIAGSSAGFDAVFAETGTYAARSVEDLVEAAEAAVAGVFPRGRRLGIVTPSGGIGILMADLAAEQGLEVPALPAADQARITALVSYAGARNPIDVTAQVVNDRALLPAIVEIGVEAGRFDAVILFLAHMGRNQEIMDDLLPPLSALRARHPDTAFIICTLHEPAMRERMRAAGFLTSSEPQHAVRVAAILAGLAAPAAPRPAVDPAFARPLPGRHDEAGARAFLEAAGIPFPPVRIVDTPEAAGAAAATLGGKVALKVLSADLPHKSDAGGVALGLGNAAEVTAAARAMLAEVARAAPAVRIEGLTVAPMITGGIETIIGSYLDPDFGPMVMLGLGGTLVELLGDVAFRRAPVTPAEAEAMARGLKGAALLTGPVRGRPAPDLAALVDAIVRVSQLAAANAAHIAEIEINPFLVLPQGGVALDALIAGRKDP